MLLTPIANSTDKDSMHSSILSAGLGNQRDRRSTGQLMKSMVIARYNHMADEQAIIIEEKLRNAR